MFSILRNGERLVKVNQHNSGSLDCLNGLRFLSATYVVIGHRYFVPLFSLPVNSFEIVEASIDLAKTNNPIGFTIVFSVCGIAFQFSSSGWYGFRGHLPGDKRVARDLLGSELS